MMLVFALGACRAGRVAGDPAPNRETTKAAASSQSPLAVARRLATTPTRENEFVDKQIAALIGQVKRRPEKIELWNDLGRAWVHKARESSDPGYYLNANGCADVALDMSPGDRFALDLRALVLLNEHRFEEARALAQSMIDRDPSEPMAWGSLSDAWLELGAIDKADVAAQKMMDLKPNLPSYSRVSYLQWVAGNTHGALESARLAIDAGGDPKSREPLAAVLVQAATLFWHRGDYDGAEAGYKTALERMPDYPPALVGRGRVALAKGDAPQAAEFFARALARSHLVETAWLLSEARKLAGDQRGAEEAFAQAVKEGKRGDGQTLSLMYSSQDREAKEALRLAEFEKRTRGGIYTEDALAWALYRNGRFADAKSAMARARRYGTKDARLLFHEGAIELALNEKDRGRQLLAEALELNPRFEVGGAAEAKRLLDER